MHEEAGVEHTAVYWHARKRVLADLIGKRGLTTPSQVVSAVPATLRKLGLASELHATASSMEAKQTAMFSLPPSSPLSPWADQLMDSGTYAAASSTAVAVADALGAGRKLLVSSSGRDAKRSSGSSSSKTTATRSQKRSSGSTGKGGARSSSGRARRFSRDGGSSSISSVELALKIEERGFGRGATLDERALRWSIAAAASEARNAAVGAASAERAALKRFLGEKPARKLTRKAAAEHRRRASIAAREHAQQVMKAAGSGAAAAKRGGIAGVPWSAWQRGAIEKAASSSRSATKHDATQQKQQKKAVVPSPSGASVHRTPRYDNLAAARIAQARLEHAIAWEVNQLSHLMGHRLARVRTKAEIGTILRAAAYASGDDAQIDAIDAVYGPNASGGARSTGGGGGDSGSAGDSASVSPGSRRKARGRGKGGGRGRSSSRDMAPRSTAVVLSDEVTKTAAEIVAVQAQMSAMEIDDDSYEQGRRERESRQRAKDAAATEAGGIVGTSGTAAAEESDSLGLPAHTTVPLLLSSRTLLQAMLAMEGTAPQVHTCEAATMGRSSAASASSKLAASEAAGQTRGTLRVQLRLCAERWELMRRFNALHPRNVQFGFDDSRYADDRRRESKKEARARTRAGSMDGNTGSGPSGDEAAKRRGSTVAFGRHVPVKKKEEDGQRGGDASKLWSSAESMGRAPSSAIKAASALLENGGRLKDDVSLAGVSLRQLEVAMASNIEMRHLAGVRRLAKHGVIKTQRRRAWAVLLQLPDAREQKLCLRRLEANARSLELLTDRIAAAEIRMVIEFLVFVLFY